VHHGVLDGAQCSDDRTFIIKTVSLCFRKAAVSIEIKNDTNENVPRNLSVCHVVPDSDKDDPAYESNTGGVVVPPKQMSSALGSLLANYGSMSESENDEEPDGEPIAFPTCYIQNNFCL